MTEIRGARRQPRPKFGAGGGLRRSTARMSGARRPATYLHQPWRADGRALGETQRKGSREKQSTAWLFGGEERGRG